MNYFGDGEARLTSLGLNAATLWDDERLNCWRDIPERSNCFLDLEHDGQRVRLHVKRLNKGHTAQASAEAEGVRLLHDAEIPTIPLLAWGNVPRGAILISEDLYGYAAADTLIEQRGADTEWILQQTAQLAARLHSANLHHQDMYLCHFFVKPTEPTHLIDAARVGKITPLPFMPNLLGQRWVVKDIAQLAYSAEQAALDEAWIERWFEHYASAVRTKYKRDRVWRGVLAKRESIRKHDAKLKQRQPGRDRSIPS